MCRLVAKASKRRRRSKTYKLAVSGTVIAGLLLLAMLLSNQRTYGYIGNNFAFVVSLESLLAGPPTRWRSSLGWVFYDPFSSSSISWQPRYIFQRGQLYTLALWKPLTLIVIPTAVFWLMERFLFPAGSCQNCGYNLKGNVSGRCSECGTTI